MPARKQTGDHVYQLKISLKGARPPIWRRVQVAGDITLGQLHQIIQASMGWYDSHLHLFQVGRMEYGQPAPEDDFDIDDEDSITLNQVTRREKFKFAYTYDFGDSWDHEILVEKILPADPETRYPVCIKGKRACPPEDCGGVWGYAEFLEAIQDPEHSEHDSMLEWVGDDFDPEYFDLEEVNQALSQIR
jgi:hypothetical protein